ncbi:MAG TPA: low-density lipoprotein receptor class A repeat-containing protein, partial [Candidatus Thalassarchaeaceae archaeon]|nr:low-density lipoprotein receptor class A repeat-containing protein [Candidatus Thalassarchaeaceae archaeon]
QTPTMIPMGGHGGMAMGVPPTTNAVLALVLGIIGWVGCGICTSLPAFFIAQSAIKTASAYPGHPDQSMANAAKWVALINVIVYVLVILLYVGIGVLAVASGDGFFVCDNGEMIPQDWVGDGDNDCGDWSDE